MTRPRCRGCGGPVSWRFARTFGDNDDDVYACYRCSTRGAVANGAAAKSDFDGRTQGGHR